MKKLSFVILLLIPLIGFGQAEKVYRSIIIDSIKARSGGIIDVKDTLKQDIGIKFNDGTFQSTAAGGGDGIYGGNGALINNPTTVTMGGNALLFSGNQTSTEGIDATSSNTSFLAEDNVGTDLLRVRNDGKIIISNATTTGILSVRGTGTTNATVSLYAENNTPTTTFFVDDEGNATLLRKLTLHQGATADNMISFFDATYKIGVLAGVLRFTSFANIELRAGATAGLDEIQFTTSAGTVKAVLDAGTGKFGVGITVPTEKLHINGNAVIDSSLSTTARTITLGVAAITFPVFSNVMTITGDGGGNTIATITGANSGMLLTLIFVDGNVTITDDNTGAADSVDLSAAFTGADDTTITLVFDGVSWYETSRSVN